VIEATATALSRFYRLHTLAVEVTSAEPAAAIAMDLRFRDFALGGAPSGPPDLQFAFHAGAESASAGVTLPLGPARPVYDTPFGTISYFDDADVLGGRLGDVAFRCDPGRGAVRIAAPALTGEALYLATHPLATIGLIELLERHGLHSLHAACVAPRAGRGVLIAGASGAGKSTLALALARDGTPLLGDDIVFLRHRTGETGVEALGFADTIGVTDYAATRFEELRARLDDAPPEGFRKRLCRVEELFGTRAVPVCTPVALVFPQVVRGEPSRIEPMPAGDALLRLVPDVLLTEPAATQAHLAAIAALLDQVNCYALWSGPDVERAAELVRALA
jgi:hypothetical protein